MKKALQYISCQTCHKPAGDRHTKSTGTCFDCSREIIAAGHRREDEREAAQFYSGMNEAERQEVIGRSRLSYGLAPSWNNLTRISKDAIMAHMRNLAAEHDHEENRNGFCDKCGADLRHP